MDKDTLFRALSVAVNSDGMVAWQSRPFHACGWNCATESHVIAGYEGSADFDVCDGSDAAKQRIAEYISGKRLTVAEGKLSAESIRTALEKWHTNDECPKCFGMGTLGLLLQDDLTERECDQCKGEGCIEGGKFPDRMEHLYLDGIAYFLPDIWTKLWDITTILGVESWNITHGSAENPLRLTSDQTPMVLVVMPSLPQQDSDPFYTIVP